MSGIEQAGLLIFAIIVVLILAARGAEPRHVERVRDGDEDTWWWSRRSWWSDRR
jgi:hypothetical protein